MMTRSCIGIGFVLALALATPSAYAQRTVQDADSDATPEYETRTAVTSSSVAPSSFRQDIASSAVGQAGRRQTREQTATQTGIEPMARIDGRIQNRVQARIRNRIDRYYDPQANATSPFVVASDQAGAANRRLRR